VHDLRPFSLQKNHDQAGLGAVRNADIVAAIGTGRPGSGIDARPKIKCEPAAFAFPDSVIGFGATVREASLAETGVLESEVLCRRKVGPQISVSRTTGIARSTIGRGLADLRSGAVRCSDRVRRKGGGQKPATETQPGILEALNDLVEPSIRGDPEAPLRWVSLSQRHLSAALAKQGFVAGQKLVGRLLKRLNFSLQANRKTREGASHPDRNPSSGYSNG
jgi:hypothetical protein